MDTFELSLDPAPTAATTARTQVTERLAAQLGKRVLEDVRLLVTELITNALRHGQLSPGDRVSLKASVTTASSASRSATPATTATSPRASPARAAAATGSTWSSSSRSAGASTARDGTTVWCELAPEPVARLRRRALRAF